MYVCVHGRWNGGILSVCLDYERFYVKQSSKLARVCTSVSLTYVIKLIPFPIIIRAEF